MTTSPFLAKPWLTRHDRRIVPTTKRLRVERARPELVRIVLETSSVVGRKPIELLFLRCCHVEVPTDAAAALFLKLVLDDLEEEEEDLRLAKVETELTISGRNVRRVRCFAKLQWWSLVTAINSWVVRWFHSVQLLRNVQFQNRVLDPREPSSGAKRNVLLNFFVSSRTAVPMIVVLERRESTGLLRAFKKVRMFCR